MQTKRNSIIEAITNTVVGLGVSFLIQIIIYPTLGIPVTLGQNIIITLVFFVASIIRGYILRRVFTKIK